MAYKTISICQQRSNIVKVLREQLGYTITNLRKILVEEFGYKSADGIKKQIKISNSTLYAPLVYRDAHSYSILVRLVSDLLEQINSKKVTGRIDCWTLRYYYNEQYLSIHKFRAEYIYGEHILILLNQNKFINYESPYYLP